MVGDVMRRITPFLQGFSAVTLQKEQKFKKI
jgi:hypothetical protein